MSGGEQRVDQAIVEGEARGVRLAGAFGQDARPGNAQAVGLHAHRFEQRNVFRVAVVVVARDVARVPVPHGARLSREHVPDAQALAVFVSGAFDLVGRRGGAPHELFRECHWAGSARNPDAAELQIREGYDGGSADARGADATCPNRFGELCEHRFGLVPTEAAVGDALTVGERLSRAPDPGVRSTRKLSSMSPKIARSPAAIRRATSNATSGWREGSLPLFAWLQSTITIGRRPDFSSASVAFCTCSSE